MPSEFIYADDLTASGRKAVRRTVTGLIGLALGVGGVLLLGTDSWRDVLAGALLAWGVTLIVWARTSFIRERAETGRWIDEMAETDVLHARLNKIGAALGIPPL
ncbi:MAG: hypothetical protein GXP36_11170, partial [Actinobacteria bacterium]|nr:hypothetical protein [Actinomycetota bacterium]